MGKPQGDGHTQEAFVFCVVEVMPEGQAGAQGAMIVPLQESFPGASISDSVLLLTNCDTWGSHKP